MKKYMFISLMASCGMLAGCNTNENSIDDYPLNYEITEVRATQDITVGAVLVNCYSDMSDETRWERLTEENDPANGKLGPNVRPAAGNYRFMGTDREEADEYAQQIGRILREMQAGGIDFAVTTPVRMHNHFYPNNVNGEDTVMLNMISGRTDTLSWQNKGEYKYAIQVNMQNMGSQLQCGSYTQDLSAETTVTVNLYDEENQATPYPARQACIDFFRKIAKYFTDDTYYKYKGNRPVLVFRESEKFFDSKIDELYADIRAVCMEVSGMNPFIIADFEQWKYAPKFTYTILKGKPDGFSPRNMSYVDFGSMEIEYIRDVATDTNMKYNREYLEANHPETTFIPSVSNGYSWYVRDGRYNCFPHNPSVDDLTKYCWIAKKHISNSNPMVLVQSYNDWGYGSYIEPDDPDYGNGVGDAYLKVIKKEFKVN